MPKGLKESDKLPEPLFTPTTKAEAGHDLPLTMPEMAKLVGAKLAEELKEKTLAVYNYAREYARADVGAQRESIHQLQYLKVLQYIGELLSELLHISFMLSITHVNEVDYKEPAQVSQTQLSGYLFCCFHVGPEGGFFHIPLV
jgi:hypothetical protein